MISLYAVARRRIGGSGGQPAAAPDPRTIDSLSSLTIDWASATTIVTAAQCGALALREQDDVIYDPLAAPDKRYACYVTAEYGQTVEGTYTPWWEVWVTYSPDGLTWAAPTRCTMNTGGALAGQDPSIVLTWDTSGGAVHRDSGGKMWMYLENHPDPANHDVHAYSSTDGLVWTLEMLNVIPRGTAGQWDSLLTGSPNARYIDGQYVVGYEGAAGSLESWGVASGSSPTALTKSPANPLITGPAHSFGNSVFMDAWWLSTDGSRIILTAHSGLNGHQMPRFYTTNLDPLTWTVADFALIGDTDPSVRNDLTAHVRADRLVTAPADDSKIVAVQLH